MKYSHEQVVKKLREFVQKHGSQKAAAKEMGISLSYLNDVLKGRREVGPKISAALGLAVVRYYK